MQKKPRRSAGSQATASPVVLSRRFLASCDGAKQRQTGQQHAVGLGFRHGGGDRDVVQSGAKSGVAAVDGQMQLAHRADGLEGETPARPAHVAVRPAGMSKVKVWSPVTPTVMIF
ncbi:hypothetical protein ACFDR9_000442 [Janthinobacterium sp. CG_23.3]